MLRSAFGRMTGKEFVMRKVIRTAILSSVAANAFETAGWKMDGDNLAKDDNGNPVWVDGGGREMSMKGDTIANLQNEAKGHRTGKETAEAALAKYRGADGKLLDPEAAKTALDKLSSIDLSKLIDSGKLDEVRAQITAEYEGKLGEANKGISERDHRINDMLIDRIFDASDFVKNDIAIPPDFFADKMRKNFKVEDGKVIATYPDGNPIYSKKSVGELADPTEALQLLVEQHPQKDQLLRAPGSGGTGSGGGGGQRGRGRVIKRADFDAMPALDQATLARQMGTGEVTIVD